jgi:DAACS family dicarboxylate/amino acid:cation (Na+ or H+) symporter
MTDPPPRPPRPRLALSTKILLGLLAGATAGTTANLLWKPAPGAPRSAAYDFALGVAEYVADPVGQVFLGLLFMVVLPLVFASLALGVGNLGATQQLGRIGRRLLQWVVLTTAAAALLGILMTDLFRPGGDLSPAQRDELVARFAEKAGQYQAAAQAGPGFSIRTLVEIIPRNIVEAAGSTSKMLGVIFFALMVGLALTRLGGDRTRSFREVLQTLYDVSIEILGWAMKLAPFGVAGLLYATTVQLGVDVLVTLSRYLAVALGGLLLWQFVALPAIAWLLLGLSPRDLFAGCRTLWITAFSTSSSNATLPTTLRTAIDRFGVPEPIAGFVMPLGATLNMNGTALFEGVSVLFLAQVAGVSLDFGMQALVILMAVMTAIGTAGVPGGSLPLLTIVLAQVGVPPAMIALIIGVDRLVDMTRTLPNVTSDLLCSIWIARRERAPGN